MMPVFKHPNELPMTHIDYLHLGLSNERIRLANATSAKERAMRAVWVAQREREIVAEEKFLGILPAPPMSDDELFSALEESCST